MSIALVEAGVEEALQHLNSNSTNLGSQGWTSTSADTFTRTRSMPNGDSYTVVINTASPTTPSITSQAAVYMPAHSMLGHDVFFATWGIPPQEQRQTTRAVRPKPTA